MLDQATCRLPARMSAAVEVLVHKLFSSAIERSVGRITQISLFGSAGHFAIRLNVGVTLLVAFTSKSKI